MTDCTQFLLWQTQIIAIAGPMNHVAD